MSACMTLSIAATHMHCWVDLHAALYNDLKDDMEFLYILCMASAQLPDFFTLRIHCNKL